MPQRVDQSRNAAACTGHLNPQIPNVIPTPLVALVPPCPLPRLEVTKLGVHMVHAPQAGVSQAHLVRILAGVVAADVFVGAGHSERS